MKISKHAYQRARQRGIKDHYIYIILDYAEYIKKLPGKVFELSISKKDIKRMFKSIQDYINYVKNQSFIKKRDKDRKIKSLKKFMNSFEKCSRKKLIVNQNMDTIITIY